MGDRPLTVNRRPWAVLVTAGDSVSPGVLPKAEVVNMCTTVNT